MAALFRPLLVFYRLTTGEFVSPDTPGAVRHEVESPVWWGSMIDRGGTRLGDKERILPLAEKEETARAILERMEQGGKADITPFGTRPLPRSEWPDVNKLLKTREISRVLGVSPITILKWHREGIAGLCLPGHPVGKRQHFKLSDYELWMVDVQNRRNPRRELIRDLKKRTNDSLKRLRALGMKV